MDEGESREREERKFHSLGLEKKVQDWGWFGGEIFHLLSSPVQSDWG